MLQYNPQNNLNLAFLGKETNFIQAERKNSLDLLTQKLNLPIKILNQTHSTEIYELLDVQIETENISADAIFTSLKNVVIGVKTADCVPLLVYTPNFVGAIHLGRKGLNDGLLQKVLEFLKTKKQNLQESYFYLGPSLSFENHSTWIQEAEQIPDKHKKFFLKGVHFLNNISIIDKYLKRNNLQLSSLSEQTSILLNSPSYIKDILTNSGVPFENITDCKVDTFENPNYHSYRRDFPDHGMNFSYIY